MANIPLQSISFPGLSDKYTTPTVDATLTQTGAAADAKKTGDELTGLKNDFTQLEDKVEDAYNAYVVETETGNIASFSDGADDVPVKNLIVAIEPVQSGSGDPSPSNVRPISGWTGANVTRTGKNLYSRENGEYNVPVYTTDGTATAYPDVNVVWIKVKPNTTYNLSCLTPSQTFYIRWINCDKNKGFISRLATQTNANLPTNVTTTSDTEWVQIACNQYDQNNLYKNDWELCVSETATAYEPYQGETYEVDWTTEAGTVYGGTLDVTTGLLTVDRAVITMDGTQSIGNNGALSYGGIQVVATPSPAKKLGATNTEGLLSDKFKIADIAEPYTLVGRTSNANLVFNMPTDVTSIELAKTWFTNNPTQVSYLLATPQTYQLTPQEVSTILGQNNIFADTGNVTVQYRADTKLYIDKVLSA